MPLRIEPLSESICAALPRAAGIALESWTAAALMELGTGADLMRLGE